MGIYSKRMTVEIGDIREDALASDAGILRILETVACDHSDEAGFGVLTIGETRVTWFILAWKVEILKRPRYADAVDVFTWGRDTERASTYRDFEMRSESGELLVRAATRWAFINVDKGMSTIPQEVMDRYGPVDKRVFEEKRIEKLLPPEGGEKTFEYTVSRRDIDLNHHVHNLFYLDFAYEALPPELWTADFTTIEINYKAAAALGDKLACYYFKDGNRHTVAIKNAETGALHAVVRLTQTGTVQNSVW